MLENQVFTENPIFLLLVIISPRINPRIYGTGGNFGKNSQETFYP